MNKRRIYVLFIMALLLSPTTLFSQKVVDRQKNEAISTSSSNTSTFDVIRQKIKEKLNEGDCDKAEDMYKAWQKTYNKSDKSIENQLSVCKKNKLPETNPQKMEDFELTVDGITFKMIYVQGGSTEIEGKTVALDGFFIGETEVTRDLYNALNGVKSSDAGDLIYPKSMSFDMAVQFVADLSRRTGYIFSIPNEAEWKFAAQGGRTSNGYTYSGSNLVDEVAWYRTATDSVVHPVKQKKPNELGIYDMSGNIAEFCSSMDSEKIYAKGGCYWWNASNCRVISRYNYTFERNKQFSNHGLRIILRVKDNQTKFTQVSKSTGNIGRATARTSSSPNYIETAFGINMQMVYVEGGTFIMGCTGEQGNDCDDDEKPAHQTTVGSFYIGMLEVTQGQWEKVMGTTLRQQMSKSGASSTYGEGSDYPMYYVNWKEAKEFCTRLSRQTGKNYRLASEAEWEYAARGGNRNEGTKYAGGSNINDVAWYHDNSGRSAHVCGTKRANTLGLYDMSGNVYEWCEDFYNPYDVNKKAVNSRDMLPVNTVLHVIRGGNWAFGASRCRVSYRDHGRSEDCSYYLGFRVVMDP